MTRLLSSYPSFLPHLMLTLTTRRVMALKQPFYTVQYIYSYDECNRDSSTTSAIAPNVRDRSFHMWSITGTPTPLHGNTSLSCRCGQMGIRGGYAMSQSCGFGSLSLPAGCEVNDGSCHEMMGLGAGDCATVMDDALTTKKTFSCLRLADAALLALLQRSWAVGGICRTPMMFCIECAVTIH
ncbi:hypothetical protein C8Q74DRAFT_615041 [Fomes fomentarius]|nr:hypothetical protein C8Q74DRAFT_615041 [Fomes fomentarius]